MNSKDTTWLYDYLRIPIPQDNEKIDIGKQKFILKDGILRNQSLLTKNQAQTQETFGFKWEKRDTYEGKATLAHMRTWLLERYGDIASADWFSEHGENPILIDAGCGAGMTTLELFGSLLSNVRYLGLDISSAVDVAATRFKERKLRGAFMQTDISNPPLPESSVDLVYSEGVLHHTDSTKEALQSLARLLKKGGRFMFYVYHRKGPLREFSDDYIRGKLKTMAPQQAWEEMKPLTQLGIALGKIEGKIDIPHSIDLLGIPAGSISVQRLFYWHVAKTFHDPNRSFEEMNHINYDWFAPSNCNRHTPEELREWCAEGGLAIEREVIENSGITIIAKKEI